MVVPEMLDAHGALTEEISPSSLSDSDLYQKELKVSLQSLLQFHDVRSSKIGSGRVRRIILFAERDFRINLLDLVNQITAL